jgi:hypothetical protein
MTGRRSHPRPAQPRHQRAENALEALFHEAGWSAEAPESSSEGGDRLPDLVVRRADGFRYAVKCKVAPEGRSDRLLPLWSQACLQASRSADGGHALAVVVAHRVPRAAAESLLEFAAEYAPHVAVGVMDFQGLRRFRGEGLEGLDADPRPHPSAEKAVSAPAGHLFSDLNQWLLKVLLAPDIPQGLLSAPRDRYRNASHLAMAADVSTMSAYRFVAQLEKEGYLDESRSHLRLVRRESLLERWQAAAAGGSREVAMRLLVGSDAGAEAVRLASGPDACLGLFAAADALQLGFVSGVPPYVYVRRLMGMEDRTRRNLVPVERGDRADLFLREAPAPRSIFRGVVERGGVFVCDVVQVWLDVAAHPSRGSEQADLIRRRVLEPVLRGESGR